MFDFKINILFVLPTLKAGGAERVISIISNNLDNKKFKTTLIVCGYQQDAVYQINDTKTIFLNKNRVLLAIPEIIKYLFQNKTDIVVGSISHVNKILAILSIFFRKIKFVGREASVLSVMDKFSTRKSTAKFSILNNYHNFLDAIVCQSTDMAEDLKKNYHFQTDKIFIINNPISENFTVKKAHISNLPTKQLITIGRLSKEKGYERILLALAKLDFDYYYTIVGTGVEKNTLINYAKQLNISDKIRFIDYTNDIDLYLSKSDVFIQGSYVEGFPNALLESCAIGTPVIAFDAPGGTKEIIENNVNGFIVNTEEEFLEKLTYTLFERQWEPEVINESVTSKFNKELILKQYEDLFITLLAANKT
jgi:glycosyltransferase involved in cell wall biosynthesis